MDQQSSKFKQIVLWPEFQVAWILLAVVLVAFIVDFAVFSSPLPLLIEGGLLLIVFVLVLVTAYRAARTDRDTKIERNELKSILGSLDDALIVYDADFQAIFFNPAAEKLFKLPANKVMGHTFVPQDVEREGWRTLTQVIFPSLAPRVIMRTKEGEYPQTMEVAFSDPQLDFRVTTAPINDDDGRLLAFMKIVRDRTSEVAVMRARSEFITVASHQLRGPVTDINWALDALAHASGLDENDKQIVENAVSASRGLLRRIEDLLNISKMEEGQFGYTFEDTDITEFVGKVLGDVLPAARKAGVKVYFDRPTEQLPHVSIDPKRLALVFVNLLENSIRYNVENGEAIVKIDKMAGKPFLEVSIRDTGIGIPEEAREKLFTKFYRADNAMKAQTEGSGLGLYIVKSIVNAHGGEIWVDSELNRGTTVHFTLPTDPNLIPQKEVGTFEAF